MSDVMDEVLKARGPRCPQSPEAHEPSSLNSQTLRPEPTAQGVRLMRFAENLLRPRPLHVLDFPASTFMSRGSCLELRELVQSRTSSREATFGLEKRLGARIGA